MKLRHIFLLPLVCAMVLMRPMFSATESKQTIIVGTSEQDKGKLEDSDKTNGLGTKILDGATMAATGIGGMQLSQGLAEKKSDEEASVEMQAYLQTISCEISGGSRDLKYGASGTTPPVTRQFADARFEYIGLAKKMKMAKEGLGLPIGIESELLIDTSNLYDGSGTNQNGIAQNFDTATERAASGSGGQKALAGGIMAGSGIVGGVVGDTVINNKDGGALKNGISKIAGSLGDNIGSMAGSFGNVLKQ